MTKITAALFITILTLSMLLPVAGQVNAASVDRSIFSQSGGPMPGGGGGGH